MKTNNQNYISPSSLSWAKGFEISKYSKKSEKISMKEGNVMNFI